MKRVLVWMDRVVAALGALLLLALLVPVSIQVFARLVPDIETPLWTEEAARFLLVWLVMVGSLHALRRGNHFTVDVLPTLGPSAARVVRILGHSIVLAFGAFFVWYGIDFVRFGWDQTSEVADWPLWILFLAWPVAGAFWMLFSILSALRPVGSGDDRSRP